MAYDLCQQMFIQWENKSAKQQEVPSRKFIKIEWKYVRNAKIKVSAQKLRAAHTHTLQRIPNI